VLLTEAPDGLRGHPAHVRIRPLEVDWQRCRPQNADSPNPDGNNSAIQEIGHHPHDTVVTREALHNWMVCAWLGA
jgi:hypothetical protein